MLILTGQPFEMDLPLASPVRCELCVVICFLTAKGTTPIDTRQLWKIYGPQRMHIKNMQKWDREFIYRHPWRTAFWLAFCFSLNNCKSGVRNAWRLVCDCSRAVRTDPWTCAMWQESSMTRIYEKCHSACKTASGQMRKREWDAESNGKLPYLYIPSKIATLVPEFAVEDLPLGKTAALVPEFAGKCPLDRTHWLLLLLLLLL